MRVAQGLHNKYLKGNTGVIRLYHHGATLVQMRLLGQKETSTTLQLTGHHESQKGRRTGAGS